MLPLRRGSRRGTACGGPGAQRTGRRARGWPGNYRCRRSSTDGHSHRDSRRSASRTVLRPGGRWQGTLGAWLDVANRFLRRVPKRPPLGRMADDTRTGASGPLASPPRLRASFRPPRPAPADAGEVAFGSSESPGRGRRVRGNRASCSSERPRRTIRRSQAGTAALAGTASGLEDAGDTNEGRCP